MARLALVVALVFVVGCGPASREQEAAEIVSVEPSQVTTKIVGASPEQERVLREILAGLGPTPLETVKVFTELKGNWGAPPNAVGVSAKTEPPSRYAYWHAYLVGEAFSKRSFELGLPPVAVIADGQAAYRVGSGARELAEPAVTLGEAQDQANRVRKLAEKNGAEVIRLDLLEPRRLAFAVELQAEDAAAFLLEGLMPTIGPLDTEHHRGIDGVYIKVLDENGKPALELGAGGWVRKDLAGCSPFLHSRGQFAPPDPPCPAEKSSSRIAFAAIPVSEVKTEIIGASPKQREVLLEALAGLGPTAIREVEVSRPEPGWKPFDDRAIALAVRGRDDLVTDWHAWLLGGEFEERSRELGLPPVSFLAAGGGETRLDGPGPPEVRPRMSSDEAREQAEEMVRIMRSAGAEVESISVLQPGRPAFDVRLRTGRPAKFLLDNPSLLWAAAGEPMKSGHAGSFVEVVDYAGRFVWHGAVAELGGSGEIIAERARPDLEGCTAAPISRPPEYTEPPCPARAKE